MGLESIKGKIQKQQLLSMPVRIRGDALGCLLDLSWSIGSGEWYAAGHSAACFVAKHFHSEMINLPRD